MKSTLICLLMCCLYFTALNAQSQKTYLEESKPLSPAAYQFLKYNALPVSQYTGIPEISIPLHEIKEDGVTVPINLNYHASGITVNEEATAVGLGWNLQFGSIVQIVNDQSDLNPSKTKQLPDYIGSSIPSELPHRWPWPYQYPGAPTSFPVTPPLADYRFPIATGEYFPVNGDYTVERFHLFNTYDYDSEPDIFKANFLGHSITFVKEWSSGGQFVVLNKAGYKVEYFSGDSWCISVPTGEKYYFGLKNVTSSSVYSSTTGGVTSNPSLSVNEESSIMWSLIKITTKNKRDIVFEYNKTTIQPHFPNVTQTWKRATMTSNFNINYSQFFRGFWNSMLGTSSSGMLTTTIFSQSESHMVPTNIIFPLGRIDFYSSDRDDVLGGKKIDSVAVTADRMRKSAKLQYSYFDSTPVGGNGFSFDTNLYGNRVNLRLKLNSVTDMSGGNYQFNYDPTMLPAKNSFAQDQWGYYNGTLSNTSFIPNPTQFNMPALGNNGNNHSANESYAKACSINQVIYPTGGSVNFDFELNTFSNYWVPDYNSSSNTLSHGNGLRVKKITWKEANNNIAKTQVFDYADGKALLPINMYRNFDYGSGTGAYSNVEPGAYFSTISYNVDEFNANGYYSPNSLAGITGVGYTQVTSKYIDQNNISTGSEISTFCNNPSIIPNNSVQMMSRINVSVPAREDWDQPKNGSIKSVVYLDQAGNLKRRSATSYINYKSPLYYGARISGYGNYIFMIPPTGSVGEWTSKLQSMVAEYPIYDFESLPSNVTDVDYYAAGDSLVTTTQNLYNNYRLIDTKHIRGNNYKERHSIGYSTLPAMIADNRIADVTYNLISKINTTAADWDRGYNDARTFNRTFTQIGNKFLPLQDVVKNAYTSSSIITTYDLYDDNGNVTQLTEPSGKTSLIWSYENKYLIATIKNALRSQVAYTGFEQKGVEHYGDWLIYPRAGESVRDELVYYSYQNDSHTGVLSTNAAEIDSKILPADNYLFTMYAKGTGTITVNGIGQAVAGGWKKYTLLLNNATKVVIENNSSLLIDDISVHPVNAQMTTYTYDPLVGMSSVTDPKGYTTYFEYDEKRRLKLSKDHNGNILKKYDYHLAGQ